MLARRHISWNHALSRGVSAVEMSPLSPSPPSLVVPLSRAEDGRRISGTAVPSGPFAVGSASGRRVFDGGSGAASLGRFRPFGGQLTGRDAITPSLRGGGGAAAGTRERTAPPLGSLLLIGGPRDGLYWWSPLDHGLYC